MPNWAYKHLMETSVCVCVCVFGEGVGVEVTLWN